MFDKLTADLAKATVSLPATRGFEISEGFLATRMRGSEPKDAFYAELGRVHTRTYRSGGIQGGISNGEAIRFAVAFKPVAAGMTSVNSVLAFAAMGPLPFGGRRESGFGRIHGHEGMLEFVWSKTVTHELFRMPGFPMLFDDPKKRLALVRQSLQALFSGSALDGLSHALRKVFRQ